MLEVVPVPSLVSVLLAAELQKGFPLTEAEVSKTRDDAAAIAMTEEQKNSVVEERGYLDIDPENPWVEWQEARKMFPELK